MAVKGDLHGDAARSRPTRHRRAGACPAAGIAFGLEDDAAGRAGLGADVSRTQAPAEPALRPRSRTLPVASDLDVELDLIARELRRGGRPVHMRPKEFLLLAVLASNPGRAFSRRQLLDLAWDSERGIDTRTVDVHVHWLRAKIEAVPRRPTHLVTVRGYGYRLDPWEPLATLTNQ
jgi:DNA-binding response OmpR family regulator